MRIQHNVTALNAYRNYNRNTSAIGKNLEKLSSGYKINRAGDDAAGLAVSQKMRLQIAGLSQAQKNAKSGISYVQTAEGALTEVHDMLERMYTLAEQSANGTFDDSTDRVQLNKELDQLKTEIDRIGETANFNGIGIFSNYEGGGAAKAVTDVTATAGKTPSTPATKGTATFDLSTVSNGAIIDIGGSKFTYTAGSAGTAGSLQLQKNETAPTDVTYKIEWNATSGADELTLTTKAAGAGQKATDTVVKAIDTTVSSTGVDGVKAVAAHVEQTGTVGTGKYAINLDQTKTLAAIGSKTPAIANDSAVTVAYDSTNDVFLLKAGSTTIGMTAATSAKDADLTASKSLEFKAVNAAGDAIDPEGAVLGTIELKKGTGDIAASDITTAFTTAPTLYKYSSGGTPALVGEKLSFAAGNSGAADESNVVDFSAKVDLSGADYVKAVEEYNKTASAGTEVDYGAALTLSYNDTSHKFELKAGSTVIETSNEIQVDNSSNKWATNAEKTATFTNAGISVSIKNEAAEVTVADAIDGMFGTGLDLHSSYEGVAVQQGTASMSLTVSDLAVGDKIKIGAVEYTLTAEDIVDEASLKDAIENMSIPGTADYQLDTSGGGTGVTANGDGTVTVDIVGKATGEDTQATMEAALSATASNSSSPTTLTAGSSTDGAAASADGSAGEVSVTVDATKVTEGMKIKIGDVSYEVTTADAADTTGATLVGSLTAAVTGGVEGYDTATVTDNGDNTFTIHLVEEAATMGAKTAAQLKSAIKAGSDGTVSFWIGAENIKSSADDLLLNKMDVGIMDLNTTDGIGLQDDKAIYANATGADGLDKINILDADSAMAALDSIKKASNAVSDMRGTLGAIQNRLDHTINNLSVMQENMTDAESVIRDTDIAEEMMAYTKNNILVQSAQAMLAQANQIPQGVLQLLQ